MPPDETTAPSREEVIAMARRWFALRGQQTNFCSADSPGPVNRMREAATLVGKGDDAAALEIYLWCFDHGTAADPAFAGVRGSFLLSEILKLGTTLGYRPALEALSERRDACERRLQSGTGSVADAYDYADLNRHSRRQPRTLAMLETIPRSTPVWDALAGSLRDDLLQYRRYEDMLRVFNPENTLENQIASLAAYQSPDIEIDLKRKLLRTCIPLVEALAGTGERDRALTLARNILGVVSHPAIREDLVQHAERAGDTTLAESLRNLTQIRADPLPRRSSP